MLRLLPLCLVLTVTASFCAAVPVKWTDCGSIAGSIRGVDVTPCPSEPCEIHLNGNVTVKVAFVSKEASQTVTAVVYGILSGVPVPMPIPDSNACDLGVKCPLQQGAQNVFSLTAYVDPSFPQVELQAQIELKDDHTNDLVCFRVPIKISL